MNFRNPLNYFSNRTQNPVHGLPQIPDNHLNTGNQISTDMNTDGLEKVIQLPTINPLEAPVGLSANVEVVHASSTQPRGLLQAPELVNFFGDSHFGLGRHNGAHYKTQDALILGRQSLVAKFQNLIETLVAQKQSKIDALRSMALQTQGVCPTVTGQIQLACTRIERDIETMRSQFNLAEQNKGWVLSALNEYQIGFGKGLREAIDMELLGQ